jgi:hypothetical protein
MTHPKNLPSVAKISQVGSGEARMHPDGIEKPAMNSNGFNNLVTRYGRPMSVATDRLWLGRAPGYFPRRDDCDARSRL